MAEKTIFPREEKADVLFNKILNDPWACEKLQGTFCSLRLARPRARTRPRPRKTVSASPDLGLGLDLDLGRQTPPRPTPGVGLSLDSGRRTRPRPRRSLRLTRPRARTDNVIGGHHYPTPSSLRLRETGPASHLARPGKQIMMVPRVLHDDGGPPLRELSRPTLFTDLPCQRSHIALASSAAKP